MPRVADIETDDRAVSAVIGASIPGVRMGVTGVWAITDTNDAVAGLIPERAESRIVMILVPQTMAAQTALRLLVLAADALLLREPDVAAWKLYGRTTVLTRARAWRTLTGIGCTITAESDGWQLIQHPHFGTVAERYRGKIV